MRLANLDAQGLTELREILMDVLDAKNPGWRFCTYDFIYSISEDEVNTNRLDFCDAVQAEIVRRAKEAA